MNSQKHIRVELQEEAEYAYHMATYYPDTLPCVVPSNNIVYAFLMYVLRVSSTFCLFAFACLPLPVCLYLFAFICVPLSITSVCFWDERNRIYQSRREEIMRGIIYMMDVTSFIDADIQGSIPTTS